MLAGATIAGRHRWQGYDFDFDKDQGVTDLFSDDSFFDLAPPEGQSSAATKQPAAPRPGLDGPSNSHSF